MFHTQQPVQNENLGNDPSDKVIIAEDLDELFEEQQNPTTNFFVISTEKRRKSTSSRPTLLKESKFMPTLTSQSPDSFRSSLDKENINSSSNHGSDLKSPSFPAVKQVNYTKPKQNSISSNSISAQPENFTIEEPKIPLRNVVKSNRVREMKFKSFGSSQTRKEKSKFRFEKEIWSNSKEIRSRTSKFLSKNPEKTHEDLPSSDSEDWNNESHEKMPLREIYNYSPERSGFSSSELSYDQTKQFPDYSPGLNSSTDPVKQVSNKANLKMR